MLLEPAGSHVTTYAFVESATIDAARSGRAVASVVAAPPSTGVSNSVDSTAHISFPPLKARPVVLWLPMGASSVIDASVVGLPPPRKQLATPMSSSDDAIYSEN